jgi:PAS domain S-box-containing protein
VVPAPTLAQQYFTKYYAVENGLSTRVITDACQDLEGCMWFSTYSGISKYDGFSFSNYDSILGLQGQNYRKIRCDEKGIVWSIPYFSTGKLVFYKNKAWHSIEPRDPSKSNFYITSFDISYQSGRLVLCIGSYNGMDVYQDDKWRHYPVSDDPSRNVVFTVKAKDGLFYLGTRAGLCVFDGKTLDWSLDKKINASKEPIWATTFENQGTPQERMWILTSHSIGYWQDNKLTSMNTDFILEDVDVANFPYLGIRKTGEVIFGNNFSKFLLKFPDKKIIPLKVKNGVSSNGALSLFIDREDNLWFTDSRGIDKINNISLVNYFESSGMPSNEVTAIMETNDGRYVLGHNNLISILEGTKFRTIEFPGFQNSVTRVLDLMKDREGNIWFSANSLGVGMLSPSGAIQWFPIAKGLRATSVCQDRSGTVWIGTNRKLLFIRGGKVIEYEYTKTLRNGVRKIFASAEGGIYVTGMNGIWYIKPDRSVTEIAAIEKQQPNVFAYFRDKEGTEFVGTMNGLYYINKGVITRYARNGLKIRNPIYFILQDKVGFYWFGTNNGVYRGDGKSEPEIYNTFNGLAGRETNRSAGLLDSHGRVWVGTDRGLSCFTPGKGRYQTPAPVVNLLYCETLSGRRYPLSEAASVSNSDNSLSFNFRGISFVNEDLITYKYKLEGYDKEWREATQPMLDKITYVNLKPGKYRLCVESKNYSSAWSKTAYSADIVIRSPFYLTWWFISLSVLGFFALLQFFHILSTQKYINKTLKKEIAERKQAEESLTGSEQRLSFVLEGSRLGTWDWDMKTNVIERNHLWAEMLGYEISEIEQTSEQWLALIHPDDKEKAWHDLHQHIDGKTPLHEIDYRMRTKDNQYKWIHDRAMIVQRDITGRPVRMSGTHSDITERKHAEEALQKSEERLRLLLLSLPVAIYIARVDSHNDLEMITGNVETLTGFSEEEYLSKPYFWRSRLHPDDHLRVMEAYGQEPEKEGITIEYRWQMANGTYKWFHDLSILKTSGTKQEYMGVIIDIDDRKRAELEIAHKNGQLNRLNAEKDKLFSIISHDLRSPVSGFFGLTTLLVDELSEMNTGQVREIAIALNNSASKVNDLLNDLLEWSLLQRGMTVFKPVSIQIREVSDECILLLVEQARLKNIELQNKIPSDRQIVADNHMLQIVLRNLLTNALKFTPKGGRVTLSLVEENTRFARISISDTGIGMSPELMAKLFIVNEKTSRKGTEGEPSSGLGLILCKEFVEKQNGKIWAESQDGKGSTFSFTVPLSGGEGT